MGTKRKFSDSDELSEDREYKRSKLNDSEESYSESDESDDDDDGDDPIELSCDEGDKCSECEHKREMIEISYMKKWGLGGCKICGCAYGPVDCSYNGDNCEGCMTHFGSHLDYEVRFLTDDELSRIPGSERVEHTDSKDPFEGINYDYDLRCKLRRVVHIDVKDTFGGNDRDD